MKNLSQFILEGKKHTYKGTIGEFARWACLGEKPKGSKDTVDLVTDEDVETIIDNGWFEIFDDDCEAAAKFLNDNWDEKITIVSQETPNDWEVSFTFNGKEYVAAFQTYFGDMSYHA